jgi:putative flavoprotein involved in K+ transport
MDGTGVLDERFDQLDDIIRARHVPSPQLVGSPERSVDLNALRDAGVELVGRLGAIRDGVALFSGGLANVFHLADQKQERLLDRFDLWAAANEVDGLGDIERPEPTREPEAVVTQLDLAKAGIGTVLWATGFKPDHSWVDLPVLDYKGRIQHDGGVLTKSPGAYLLGASLLRRRRSTYIDGAAQDTAELAEHLAQYLDTAAVASPAAAAAAR